MQVISFLLAFEESVEGEFWRKRDEEKEEEEEEEGKEEEENFVTFFQVRLRALFPTFPFNHIHFISFQIHLPNIIWKMMSQQNSADFNESLECVAMVNVWLSHRTAIVTALSGHRVTSLKCQICKSPQLVLFFFILISMLVRCFEKWDRSFSGLARDVICLAISTEFHSIQFNSIQFDGRCFFFKQVQSGLENQKICPSYFKSAHQTSRHDSNYQVGN